MWCWPSSLGAWAQARPAGTQAIAVSTAVKGAVAQAGADAPVSVREPSGHRPAQASHSSAGRSSGYRPNGASDAAAVQGAVAHAAADEPAMEREPRGQRPPQARLMRAMPKRQHEPKVASDACDGETAARAEVETPGAQATGAHVAGSAALAQGQVGAWAKQAQQARRP